MKKKIITIIVIIMIIVLVVLTVNKRNFSTQEIIEFPPEEGMLYEEGEMTQGIQEKEESKTIKGKGTIVSFHTEKIDTEHWSKIEQVYVNEGDIIKANQKILKVSNQDATGVIYSTISGKFFIEEMKDRKNYLIYDLENIGFEMEVGEEEASKLKIGQFVNVNINSLSEAITGKVYYISKISNGGIIKVKVKIDYDERIKFGYTAKAEILLDKEIDTTVKEFDTKDSFIKIGKTAITYKNVPNTSNIEVPDMLEFSEDMLGESDLPMEESEIQNPDELEYDMEDISDYYNGYWSEYWNEYWREYWRLHYENGQIGIEEDV